MAGRHYTPLGYCDSTDIENFLLLTIDSSFSPQIDDWIATAEKMVNQFTGYTTASGILAEAVVGETAISHVDGESNLMIFPRKIPIISVSSIQLFKGTSNITLNLTSGTSNRYNIPTSADYILYPDYELSLTGASIISSFGYIKYTKFFSKINYIGGYTEVPADIRLATVNFVADMIMRHSNKEGLVSMSQGKVSKRWQGRDNQSDFTRDAYDLLKNYRIASLWIPG